MTDLPLLWSPSEKRVADAHISHFMQEYCPAADDYQSLWEWSVNKPDEFWRSVWEYGDIIGDMGEIIHRPDVDIKKTRFFPEAKLNFAENLLRNPDDRTAIVFTGEDGRRQQWSRKELYNLTSRIAQALRAEGIIAGDRIAGFVPNMAESIAAMLATASIGAVWSSCSPDFGAAGVEDRFGQIKPKVLFAASGYFYSGKQIDCAPALADIASRLPSVQKIVVWDYAIEKHDLSTIPSATSLSDFIADYPSSKLEFTPMPFDAPLYILFSSGTTGKPKCIVHRAGGILLQHLKELKLQSDVKAGSKFFYFTTCGWMMWNWLVSGLAAEATLYLYDGNPMHPDKDRLLDLAADENIEIFGTSAKFIDACSKSSITPKDTHDLSALQTVLSTGSPLAPDNFSYIYNNWKSDILLGSISGGTDICGVFIGATPILPVHKGAIQCKHLGLDVQVFTDEGTIATDEPGELVCCNAHPTMPIGFWDDADGQKYHNAYFNVFANTWRHGDYLLETAEGGFIVQGRSDATLNPGGVRIGTAEIYRQVEAIPEILEGLVIGQNWDNDVRVVLFVRLADGVKLDEMLIKKIKTMIRTNATPRHVPAKVIAVSDIPRTKSGKITELAVRDVVHGKTVKNQTALSNPEALELYINLPELSE